MDKGTIKNFSLLSFPICEKGFLFAVMQIKALTERKERRMKKEKSWIKILLATLALFAIAVLLYFVFLKNIEPPTEGIKKITVRVIVPGEDVQEFAITTEADTLRQALEEEGLIKGQTSTYGFFITEVNGRKADDSKQEWWCITKDGESISSGADLINIRDNDKYELTLMEGY